MHACHFHRPGDCRLAVVRRVGDELHGDPAFKGQITRPFEVVGVDRLAPVGATLNPRVTTEPQAQWRVGREYNRRLKAAFDTDGIGVALHALAARKPCDEEGAGPLSELRPFARPDVMRRS